MVPKNLRLLEEAAVLLALQTHNLRLRGQSAQTFLGSLHAFSSAVDARDQYTRGHSDRVARLAFNLARCWGLCDSACLEIYVAGILHDIGKIGIPDRVLLKEGPLTDDEFKLIQRHPEIGYRIVQRLGHLQFALPGILYHHERWDGQGYPHGLQGNCIPLMARILAVADAFDAMTSCRPYRRSMSVEQAEQIIASGIGKQWDGLVVECFMAWLSRHKNNCQASLSTNFSCISNEDSLEFLTLAVRSLADREAMFRLDAATSRLGTQPVSVSRRQLFDRL
jgi:HD-GYP domain-containing protein (c-di-GMP phosphodiesterase class II)